MPSSTPKACTPSTADGSSTRNSLHIMVPGGKNGRMITLASLRQKAKRAAGKVVSASTGKLIKKDSAKKTMQRQRKNKRVQELKKRARELELKVRQFELAQSKPPPADLAVPAAPGGFGFGAPAASIPAALLTPGMLPIGRGYENYNNKILAPLTKKYGPDWKSAQDTEGRSAVADAMENEMIQSNLCYVRKDKTTGVWKKMSDSERRTKLRDRLKNWTKKSIKASEASASASVSSQSIESPVAATTPAPSFGAPPAAPTAAGFNLSGGPAPTAPDASKAPPPAALGGINFGGGGGADPAPAAAAAAPGAAAYGEASTFGGFGGAAASVPAADAKAPTPGGFSFGGAAATTAPVPPDAKTAGFGAPAPAPHPSLAATNETTPNGPPAATAVPTRKSPPNLAIAGGLTEEDRSMLERYSVLDMLQIVKRATMPAMTSAVPATHTEASVSTEGNENPYNAAVEGTVHTKPPGVPNEPEQATIHQEAGQSQSAPLPLDPMEVDTDTEQAKIDSPAQDGNVDNTTMENCEGDAPSLAPTGGGEQHETEAGTINGDVEEPGRHVQAPGVPQEAAVHPDAVLSEEMSQEEAIKWAEAMNKRSALTPQSWRCRFCKFANSGSFHVCFKCSKKPLVKRKRGDFIKMMIVEWDRNKHDDWCLVPEDTPRLYRGFCPQYADRVKESKVFSELAAEIWDSVNQTAWGKSTSADPHANFARKMEQSDEREGAYSGRYKDDLVLKLLCGRGDEGTEIKIMPPELDVVKDGDNKVTALAELLGSTCPAHTDSMGGWLIVLEGTKDFYLCQKSDVGKLKYKSGSGDQQVFHDNPFTDGDPKDLWQFGTMKAGDGLYIPKGCAHIFRSAEMTAARSYKVMPHQNDGYPAAIGAEPAKGSSSDVPKQVQMLQAGQRGQCAAAFVVLD